VLCEAIIEENDSERLIVLVRQLNQTLEEREMELRHGPDADKSARS
jgi:hypothetical protein